MDYQRGYRIPIRIPRGVCIDIQTRVGETEISLAAFRSRFFLLFSNLTTLSSRVVGHLFERQGEEGGLKRELPSFLSFFLSTICVRDTARVGGLAYGRAKGNLPLQRSSIFAR